MSLDNLSALATDPEIAVNVARSEQVLEFARKSSPVEGASFPTPDSQPTSDPANARDLRGLPDSGRTRVALPKDATKPLVTASHRQAREALEAYKSLRARLLKSQSAHAFRSISVTSVGRADGKTLTAFNLACCWAQAENQSVLLVDGDLRNRTLSKLIRGLPSVGLSDALSGRVPYDSAIVATDVPNLYVLGAGSGDPANDDLYSTERLAQLLAWAQQHFKLVLVDALSADSAADFDLRGAECDGILLVVRARSTSRQALKAAIEQVDPGRLIGIVWNAFVS